VVIAAQPWAWLPVAAISGSVAGAALVRVFDANGVVNHRELGLGNMRIHKLLAGAAVAATVMTTGIAQAGTVIIPLASNTTTTPIGPFETPPYGSGTSGAEGSGAVSSTHTLGAYPNPAYAFTESASVALVPQPTLNVSVSGISGHPFDNTATSAEATSTYFFSITGPSDVMVPVEVNSSINGSFNPQFSSDPAIFLTGYVIAGGSESTGSGEVGLSICPGTYGIDGCAASGLSSNSVHLDQVVDFSSNSLIEVQMLASIAAADDPLSYYSGSLSVDPLFTIDPAFLASNPGYSLSFSSGVGNSASAVPEPATWAMLLLGIGGIGAAMRSQRRKPSVLGAVTAA
jgi:PEP-CTERM motif